MRDLDSAWPISAPARATSQNELHDSRFGCSADVRDLCAQRHHSDIRCQDVGSQGKPREVSIEQTHPTLLQEHGFE
jgi:hypothetical protein